VVVLIIGVGALTMVGLLAAGMRGEILFGVVLFGEIDGDLIVFGEAILYGGILTIITGLGMLVFLEIVGTIDFGITTDFTETTEALFIIAEELV
jgi:hypothetical protein